MRALSSFSIGCLLLIMAVFLAKLFLSFGNPNAIYSIYEPEDSDYLFVLTREKIIKESMPSYMRERVAPGCRGLDDSSFFDFDPKEQKEKDSHFGPAEKNKNKEEIPTIRQKIQAKAESFILIDEILGHDRLEKLSESQKSLLKRPSDPETSNFEIESGNGIRIEDFPHYLQIYPLVLKELDIKFGPAIVNLVQIFIIGAIFLPVLSWMMKNYSTCPEIDWGQILICELSSFVFFSIGSLNFKLRDTAVFSSLCSTFAAVFISYSMHLSMLFFDLDSRLFDFGDFFHPQNRSHRLLYCLIMIIISLVISLHISTPFSQGPLYFFTLYALHQLAGGIERYFRIDTRPLWVLFYIVFAIVFWLLLIYVFPNQTQSLKISPFRQKNPLEIHQDQFRPEENISLYLEFLKKAQETFSYIDFHTNGFLVIGWILSFLTPCFVLLIGFKLNGESVGSISVPYALLKHLVFNHGQGSLIILLRTRYMFYCYFLILLFMAKFGFASNQGSMIVFSMVGIQMLSRICLADKTFKHSCLYYTGSILTLVFCLMLTSDRYLLYDGSSYAFCSLAIWILKVAFRGFVVILSVTNMNEDYYETCAKTITAYEDSEDESEGPGSSKKGPKRKEKKGKSKKMPGKGEKSKGPETSKKERKQKKAKVLSRQSSTSEESDSSDQRGEIEEQNIFYFLWKLLHTLILTHLYFVVASHERNMVVRMFCSFGGCYFLFKVLLLHLGQRVFFSLIGHSAWTDIL